jgi:putative hydrolase of the HAD superfamily
MQIKTITFDLDDTLWHCEATIVHAENTHRQWLEKNIPTLAENYDTQALFALRNKAIQQDPNLAHRISDLRKQVLSMALIEIGHDPFEASRLSQSAFDVFIRARQKVFVFDGVHHALAELANHFRLGVITNGNANVYQTELGSYFDFAICADKVGKSKPSRRPFHAAMQHAQCEANQILHIGDHPIHDIEGARRMGFECLWYNPSKQAWTEASVTPKHFSNFTDLTAIVRSFEDTTN